jgi:UDPglucose 6-dehydrogenase
MKVCVIGLWHLGLVTAACAASLGHEVVAFDNNRDVVGNIQRGTAPIREPGLDDLWREQISRGHLTASDDIATAVRGARVVWVTHDTPVDQLDRADAAAVVAAVEQAFPHIEDGAVVLISSQLPVGSTRLLEQRFRDESAGRNVSFACSPENLRLGKAIDSFLNAERIVVGARQAKLEVISELFGPLADRILWTSVESAEMTKHALNAFLATSVTFINELSVLCESVGADAGQVEQALKTDRRIGVHAYLSPGAAFAGGTLARDVEFLRAIGAESRRSTFLLDGVAASNAQHREWPMQRLERSLGQIAGHRIAVWGLTYKPGTSTLRRSDAVELCNTLVARGAAVSAHDPTVSQHPDELDRNIAVAAKPEEAARGADALIIATGWPEYRQFSADTLFSLLRRPLIIDANRFLTSILRNDRRFEHVSVGVP